MLREAFRELKASGRFAVSDVVVRGEVPMAVRQCMELWVGCVAGALQDSEYTNKLEQAAIFRHLAKPTRVYGIQDARTFLSGKGIKVDTIAPQLEGRSMRIFVRGVKAADCCAPGCCS